MAKSIKLRVSSRDGETPKIPGRGEFDIRDRLTELVGKGNTLSPDDKAAIYGNLVSSLGKDKAEKVMSHAFIFNQRPDIQGLSLQDKIRQFYSMGSNDKDVNDLIVRSRTLGYGVVPGFQQSSSAINQQLSGQTPIGVIPETATINPEAQRKIMLRVNK